MKSLSSNNKFGQFFQNLELVSLIYHYLGKYLILEDLENFVILTTHTLSLNL